MVGLKMIFLIVAEYFYSWAQKCIILWSHYLPVVPKFRIIYSFFSPGMTVGW
jgi:hypothetical protein